MRALPGGGGGGYIFTVTGRGGLSREPVRKVGCSATRRRAAGRARRTAGIVEPSAGEDAPVSEDQTTRLQGCIDRLLAGDEAARDGLLAAACERPRVLSRRM